MKKRMKKSNEWSDIETPSNNLAPVKTKKNIKQLMPLVSGLTFIGISGLLVATSIGLSVPNSAISPNLNGKLLFDDKVFKNKEELLAYAQQNYFQRTDTVENHFNWSIDERGEKVYFNDPKLLRKHLLNNIKQTSALSSKKFNENEGGLGEVNPRDFAHLYFNQTKESLQSTIYRGKNNSIHDTIEKAKDSYLSIHDAYYFNNIYFKNIEELKVYLQTVYYVPGGEGYSSLKPQNIGIVGPSGVVSSAMEISDLFSQEIMNEKSIQTKKDFMNNISNQSKKYLEFTMKEASGTKYFYTTEEDLNKPGNDLLNVYTPEYTSLHTNDGKGTYIVDLDKEDQNTLFGPYYFQSKGDIEGINDIKRNWKPIDHDDPLLTSEQNSSIISGLLDMILFADDSESSQVDINAPFNISYLNKDVIVPFYNLLKKSHKNIYDEWVNLSNIVKSGQKWNTFSNLPIFYIFLMEKLVENGARQEIIIETKKMFNSIAQYIDKSISILVPKKLLKIDKFNSKYGEYLSFEEIFNFNSNDKNLNTDLSYFISEISGNFSQFIVAINIITQANLNSMYNGGVLPYRQEFIREIMGINSNMVKEEMIDSYQIIWDIFSSYNVNVLKQKIQNLNQGNAVDPDFLTELANSLSITNSLFVEADKFLFIESFKDISISNGSIINDKNDILASFVNNSSSSNSSQTYSSIIEKIVLAKNLTYENLMLIKFIHKGLPSALNKITNFGIDQELLSQQLIEIVKNMNMKIFSSNFIINHKITNSLVKASSEEMRSNFLNFGNEVISSTSKITSMLGTITGILTKWDEKGEFNSANATNFLKKITSNPLFSKIAKGIPYVQIGLIAFDLISGILPETSYSSYKFALEGGPSFIWNGGKNTTMFFGLINLSSVSIDKMKLLPLQMIVKPKDENSWYFNGKLYNDINKLKQEQLRAILNGEFSAKNVKVVYSFDNIPTNDLVTERSNNVFYNFGTIDDLKLSPSINFQPYEDRKLVQYVYQSINSAFISGDKNHWARKYYRDKFIFANGVVVDSNSTELVDTLITNVVDNISSVKIAMLPQIIEGKPIYNDENKDDDGSIGKYTLPSVSWSSSGLFSVNRTANQYIIFDPNQVNEFGTKISNSDAERSLKRLFYNYFDVDWKSVIKYEIPTNNMFSGLNSSITSNVIFKVKLENNMTKYFFDEVSAFKWLVSQKNFTLYSYTTTNDVYKYQDKLFNSRDEFINFVLSEATMEVN